MKKNILHTLFYFSLINIVFLSGCATKNNNKYMSSQDNHKILEKSPDKDQKDEEQKQEYTEEFQQKIEPLFISLMEKGILKKEDYNKYNDKKDYDEIINAINKSIFGNIELSDDVFKTLFDIIDLIKDKDISNKKFLISTVVSLIPQKYESLKTEFCSYVKNNGISSIEFNTDKCENLLKNINTYLAIKTLMKDKNKDQNLYTIL